jgi:hypothetical protein
LRVQGLGFRVDGSGLDREVHYLAVSADSLVK